MYTPEPEDPSAFTASFDTEYSRIASIYDFLVRRTPLWKSWIAPAIPHIQGPRVLEVSFGTGWLLTQYASRFHTFGIDLNAKMLAVATHNLAAAHVAVPLVRGGVESLPYRSASFDTVVNTMSFSGYPRADTAMAEISRVLKATGRLVLIDIAPPPDRNWLGAAMIRLWAASGDIVRDMDGVLQRHGFAFSCEPIGGFGSVHLYVAAKANPKSETTPK
jgi:ubiquinone/menaquinone biosynthesis C-methylase UbiE